MDEQETLCSTRIHYDPKYGLAHVRAKCRGTMVTFLVDTGCCHCRLTSRQIALLGFDESEVRGDDGEGFICVEMEIDGYTFTELFFVLDDIDDNLLGTNFLFRKSCLINLKESTLTLRGECDTCYDRPMATVRINGKDVDVVVDIGYSGWMNGPLSLARELNLPLVSEGTPPIRGVGYSGRAPYRALVPIRAFGREVRDALFVVHPKEQPKEICLSAIGMELCVGTLLQFNQDGTFEVTRLAWEEPTGNSEEPAVAAAEGLQESH